MWQTVAGAVGKRAAIIERRRALRVGRGGVWKPRRPRGGDQTRSRLSQLDWYICSLGPNAALYDPSSSSLSVRPSPRAPAGFFPFFFSFLYFLPSGLLALLARSRVILSFT